VTNRINLNIYKDDADTIAKAILGAIDGHDQLEQDLLDSISHLNFEAMDAGMNQLNDTSTVAQIHAALSVMIGSCIIHQQLLNRECHHGMIRKECLVCTKTPEKWEKRFRGQMKKKG
jgi:hypothetical protein